MHEDGLKVWVVWRPLLAFPITIGKSCASSSSFSAMSASLFVFAGKTPALFSACFFIVHCQVFWNNLNNSDFRKIRAPKSVKFNDKKKTFFFKVSGFVPRTIHRYQKMWCSSLQIKSYFARVNNYSSKLIVVYHYGPQNK